MEDEVDLRQGCGGLKNKLRLSSISFYIPLICFSCAALTPSRDCVIGGIGLLCYCRAMGVLPEGTELAPDFTEMEDAWAQLPQEEKKINS